MHVLYSVDIDSVLNHLMCLLYVNLHIHAHLHNPPPPIHTHTHTHKPPTHTHTHTTHTHTHAHTHARTHARTQPPPPPTHTHTRTRTHTHTFTHIMGFTAAKIKWAPSICKSNDAKTAWNKVFVFMCCGYDSWFDKKNLCGWIRPMSIE